jgi:ABC-type polysaccharide/polyol phosphate transport system ATPase subunit
LEGKLNVEDNLLGLGVFLGCATRELERDSRQLAELAGLADQLDVALDDLPPTAAVKLALAVVLELAMPELLLVDLLPHLPDRRFRAWLAHKTWQLRRAGGAVVQVIFDGGQLLGPVDRMLWIGDRQLRASGHGPSVLEARWRSQLGLGRTTDGISVWESFGTRT